MNIAGFCDGGAKGRLLSLENPLHLWKSSFQCTRHLQSAEIIGREVEHADVIFLDCALFVTSIADSCVRCEKSPIVFSYERQLFFVRSGAREMGKVALHRDLGLCKNVK